MTEEKNLGGRPREFDRDQIAIDLIEWAKKDDSINLNKFCAYSGISPSYLSIWAGECNKFSKAYEYAKTFIGFRREELLNSELLHVKAYDLNAKTYDYFLNEQAQRTATFESSLRKEEDNKKETTVNVKVSSDGLGRGVKVSAEGVPVTNNRSSKHRD